MLVLACADLPIKTAAGSCCSKCTGSQLLVCRLHRASHKAAWIMALRGLVSTGPACYCLLARVDTLFVPLPLCFRSPWCCPLRCPGRAGSTRQGCLPGHCCMALLPAPVLL